MLPIWTTLKICLPNSKILALTKLKTFVDDKSQVASIRIFVSDREENIVAKGENAGKHHFLLFPNHFLKGIFLKVMITMDCLGKG